MAHSIAVICIGTVGGSALLIVTLVFLISFSGTRDSEERGHAPFPWPQQSSRNPLKQKHGTT